MLNIFNTIAQNARVLNIFNTLAFTHTLVYPISMIKRELYLERIRPFYDSELIKVITGVRRCGKSTVVFQIIEELKSQGVKDDQIIYINFEDYQFQIISNPDSLYNYIKKEVHPTKKTYHMND